jgi:hypothetical protein
MKMFEVEEFFEARKAQRLLVFEPDSIKKGSEGPEEAILLLNDLKELGLVVSLGHNKTAFFEPMAQV